MSLKRMTPSTPYAFHGCSETSSETCVVHAQRAC